MFALFSDRARRPAGFVVRDRSWGSTSVWDPGMSGHLPKVALRRPDRIRQLGKNSAVNALVRACEDPSSIHADDPQEIWWTEDDELPVGCTW